MIGRVRVCSTVRICEQTRSGSKSPSAIDDQRQLVVAVRHCEHGVGGVGQHVDVVARRQIAA